MCIRDRKAADRVTGTSGMLEYAGRADGGEFIVGTESGMVYRLQKAFPNKEFYPATDHFICPTMKMTTLEKIRAALQEMKLVVKVPEPIQREAKRALEAMLAV